MRWRQQKVGSNLDPDVFFRWSSSPTTRSPAVCLRTMWRSFLRTSSKFPDMDPFKGWFFISTDVCPTSCQRSQFMWYRRQFHRTRMSLSFAGAIFYFPIPRSFPAPLPILTNFPHSPEQLKKMAEKYKFYRYWNIIHPKRNQCTNALNYAAQSTLAKRIPDLSSLMNMKR